MHCKKVVLIGVDAATLGFFKKLAKKGLLPNLEKLMKTGVYMEAFPSPPPATAVNWSTVVTGAHAATHGVTAMSMHNPGDPLDKKYYSGFFSSCRKAEALWEIVERIGKKVILLKYPGTWPPVIKKGVQVEGFGDPGWNILAIAPRLCFANYNLPEPKPLLTRPPKDTLPKFILSKIVPANGWKNPPFSYSKPLEAELTYTPRGGKRRSFYMLMVDSKGEGYDKVVISTNKDGKNPVAFISEGEWSKWISLDFETEKGVEEGIFRFKLMELSKKGDKFKLFASQIFPKKGWTVPEDISSKLLEKVGPFQGLNSVNGPYVCGWIDEKTLFEEIEYHTKWLAEAAKYLLSNYEWDLFCTQLHIIDHMGHLFLGGMDPKCIFYDPEREKICEEMIVKTYQLADMFIGKILENLDEQTLVVVTSDHGQIPIRAPGLNANELLAKHGLINYKENPIYWVYPYVTKRTIDEIDWSKTKAYEACESFVYINLKGREPHGIVEPGEEYEKVRNQVINILREAKDPQTGDSIVAIVLKREEAEFLGLYGEYVGDVIYLLNTEYSSCPRKVSPKIPNGGFGFTANHHGYLHSSKFEDDIFTERAVTIFKGPGIVKGQQRSRPIHLIDIAPTISYLMGWPVPKQSEGAILFDILE